MPSTLHLASVGGGKTEFAIDRLIATIWRNPQAFPTIWVLLATRRQALNFRRRLAEREPDIPAYFNVSFFNFYTLNRQLLNRAGIAARRIERPTQAALLRSLARQLRDDGELGYFSQIAGRRGFISILNDLIKELKQNGVSDESFEGAARTEKDRDIAALYRRYQETLRASDLVDPEGEGWLALATLQKQGRIAEEVDLLLVDGFDQFTQMQARLLAELARNIGSVEITLTAPPDPATGLLRRSAQTRTLLRSAHEEAGVGFSEEFLRLVGGERHPDLVDLGQAIFTGGTGGDKSEALRLIAAPTPVEEVRAVLRAVKAQLLAGVRPDEILIASRDPRRYASAIRQAADEYGLPLLQQQQAPLQDVPALAVLINLLELSPRFRRIDVLDVLRSPYISSGLSDEEIDLLDRLSMEAQFTRGSKADWLHLLRAKRGFRPEIEDDSPVASAKLESVAAKLDAFFEGITPPSVVGIADIVRWLDDLIGPDFPQDSDTTYSLPPEAFTVNLLQNVQLAENDDHALARRDLMAVNALKGLLRENLQTEDLLRVELGQARPTEWGDFWDDLKHGLRNESYAPYDPPRENRVLVTAASEARGLPHRHVYILGLAEGLFPAEQGEDPLYLDSEREGLQARGIALKAAAERSDDRGLFYELISLPRESLTLSRPTVQDGKPWIESYLWRAVLQVYPRQPVRSLALGHLIGPGEAASPAELMLALSNRSQGSADKIPAASIHGWLRQHPVYERAWQRILQGQRIEASRLSRAPYDHHSGHLARASMVGEAARRLSPERLYSASQLKDYGLCGFRYFAKRLLKLEEVSEPDEGYDALQLGLLYHKILEETYGTIKSLGISIREENQESALAILERSAAEILADAPKAFGFRAGVTWPAEKDLLKRRLRALVELDFSDDSPLNALGDNRTVHAIEHYFTNVDVDLPGQEQPLRLRGVIDRIDEVAGRLLVVDYKTGTRPIPLSEMEEGRDFQMMSYALAILSETEPDEASAKLAGGMFWHLRDLRQSGKFEMENDEHRLALDAALAHVSDNLRQGRMGRFPVQPTALDAGKCARYCEYARLCRMTVTNRFKEASD